MGRESFNDHHRQIVTQSSSIALLQERFRQLERMKEMREGRELQRKLAESKLKQCNINRTCFDQPPPSAGLLFFHLLTTQRHPGQAPNLSLWSGSQSQHSAPASSLGYMEAPLFSLLPTAIRKSSSTLHVSRDKFQHSDYCDDVDTSLHL